MKIYIDSDFKCHATNLGSAFKEVETSFFDGKCDTFIEGYLFFPTGEIITPWKDHAELDAVQREYERQLLKELQENSIPVADLEAAYQEGVDSAYD